MKRDETGAAGVNQASPFDDPALYDAMFENFDFDRSFYLELARRAKGPVLEVACGTGRILIPCMEAGIDIDGVDLHQPMLAALRRKAGVKGLLPRVYAADMRDFTLPRRYALVFIAFNGFTHAITTEDQLRTLRVCREHLLPGGQLVFNIFYPGIEYLTGSQGIPILEGEVARPETGTRLQMYDTRTFNRIEQVQHSSVELRELDAEGRIAKVHRSETQMRWTFKCEMELLLNVSGFLRWEIQGSFDGRPLENETDLMVVFAWRD